jgi:hypothetical protein
VVFTYAACIRAGVPVGLETSEGLIVLGKGMKGPAITDAAKTPIFA